MQGNSRVLLELLDKCLINKLSKEYHDTDFRIEYQLRNNTLLEDFEKITSLITSSDLAEQTEAATTTLAYLLLLYLELKTSAPWNTEQIKDMGYTDKLNKIFKNKHNVELSEVLQNDLFDCQVIFDKCLQELHKKMTVNDLKKYPGSIEAYCLLLKNVKNYKVYLNPVTVLPAALLMIDDYVTKNKIKGLLSCAAVLQCLTVEDFTAGNYYEVVYSSLKKNIVEKDRELTQILFQCFLEFLKVVPLDIKKMKLDDIFSSVVDQLQMESNLYRKADCFDFLTKIIDMHGINCAKKTTFKSVVRDSIDICSEQSVSEILLLHVLECYQIWLKYCWCIWNLFLDHKMLSSLFKVLYLSKDEDTKLKIQNLIVTLVKLCTKQQQTDILENLYDPPNCSNEDFQTRLDTIYSCLMLSKYL